jgi:hypothetical protein
MFNDDYTSLHSQFDGEPNHFDLISIEVHLVFVSRKQLPPTQEIIYGPNSTHVYNLLNVNIEKVEVNVGLPIVNIDRVEVNVQSQELPVNVKRNKEHKHFLGQRESLEVIHVLRMLPLSWLIKS